MTRGLHRSLGGGIFLLLVAGCSRPSATANGDSGTPSVAAAGDAPRASGDPIESRQTSYLILGVLNPLLRSHLQVLGNHFGGEGEEPFAVERVELPEGRVALLVARLDEQDPIVLVVDHDRLVWSKPYPTAGAPAPLTRLALAPGRDGGVTLFGYAPSTHVAWQRSWAEVGSPLPDTRVASFDECDTLSAVHARALGWLVACASGTGTRAQLVRENGEVAWGDGGAAVGDPEAVGPATLLLSSPTSWVLVQHVQRGDLDHVFVFRYDLRAAPIWAGPADLGVPRRVSRTERFAVKVVDGAAVRVELPQGLRGMQARAAEAAPDGSVRIIDP